MKSKLIALLLLSSCLSLPAVSQVLDGNDTAAVQQSTVNPEVNPAMTGMVEKVNILTRSKAVTEITENEPVPLDMGLVDVPGASKELTTGVTAKAYARYVQVEDQKIGQLVLSSVEKEGRSEPLNSDDFVAQFDMKETRLDPTSPITIEGDQSALIAALERLAEAPSEEQAEEKEVADDAGVGASDGKVASNAANNPGASEYSTPSALDVGKEPVISSNITTEGCEIRTDLDQLQAIQQTRVVTTTDGAPEYGECADGSERFTINQSYAVCPYDENTETMKATAQFMYYYTDGGGNRQEIGDCQPDAEKIFDIVEDRNACNVYLDYVNLQAVPQGKLVYTNHNGKVVPVADCAASIEVEPVKLVETTEGCDIRDDFLANKSFGRSKYIYTLEGQDWDTSCQDNDDEYPHSTIYKTAGGDQVCDPIINRDTGKVTLQSRVMINVNGFELYRTPCTPDASTKDILATTAGCEDPAKWTHNITASQSIGQERFYYLLDGKQEPVTECQDNGVIYPHQQELTGWQPHDAQLFSYRLVTVYIEGVPTPTGRYNVLTSQVLPGDPQVPYTYVGVGPATNGEKFYEGCTRFDEQDEVETYRRPDDSIHKVIVGEAAPLSLGNKCYNQIEWGAVRNWRYENPQSVGHSTGGPCGTLNDYAHVYDANYHCTFAASDGTKTTIREDGEIIGTATNTCTIYNRYSPVKATYYTGGSDADGSFQGYVRVGFPSSGWSYPTHTTGAKSNCLGLWGWLS